MKRGHRLYSIIDGRYFPGVFRTITEIVAYANYLGLSPGDYRIDSGAANIFGHGSGVRVRK